MIYLLCIMFGGLLGVFALGLVVAARDVERQPPTWHSHRPTDEELYR